MSRMIPAQSSRTRSRWERCVDGLCRSIVGPSGVAMVVLGFVLWSAKAEPVRAGDEPPARSVAPPRGLLPRVESR